EHLPVAARRLPLTQHLSDQPLAASFSVPGRGIDEVAAQVECPVQRLERILILLRAPRAANRPGTKADLGAVEPMFAERTCFHGGGRFETAKELKPLRRDHDR